MANKKVLLVDDDAGARFAVREYLAVQKFDVEEADSIKSALEAFSASRPDVALLDYRLPDGNALQLLPRLKAIDPIVPVIILTGHGSIDLAVQAIKEGAEQFFTKPLELPALLIVIRRLIENQKVQRKAMAGTTVRGRRAVDPFLGTSRAIVDLAEQARKVLSSESPILIQGETGTGKGILARWLHDQGPRADEAFVDLNCAGLTREFLETELFGHEKGAFTGAVASKPGLLEVADRGTVFLDEIGDVDANIQPRLLKVLEEKQFHRLGDVRTRRVDIRLLGATHQDLGQLVRDGRFRGDLFYRISTIPLMVPPLRNRQEDIPILAEHFLAGFGQDFGRSRVRMTPEAADVLSRYPWPGNIRELRNVLERALLLMEGDTLNGRDLRFNAPTANPGYPDAGLTLLELERKHIEYVLRDENGRVEKAAARLGIARSSLYQKIKKFNIVLSEF